MAGASKARRYILSPLLRARSRCATTISQRNGTTASQADGFDRRHRRRARQARAVSVGHQSHGPASRRVWGEVITFRCVWRCADMGLGTAVWRCLYARAKKGVDHALDAVRGEMMRAGLQSNKDG